MTNSSVSHNSTQGSVRTTVSVDNGDFGGMDFGGMLFPGVSGNRASNLFGTGLPELERVQQHVTQNPNMARETINMPVIQGLMNDPDVMRNLIASNPLVREIIDRNPDLGHVLNDPSILRQTLEVARNPELRREMMRNSDRALRNIESSPEGFNMLRRMYETVQEPFINASTMTGDGGNDLRSNTFAALLGNPEAGQARERSLNPSTTGSETTMGSPGPNTNPLPNPWAGGAQTNSTATRPASVLDTRTPRTGRLGFPGLSRMLGGLPDPSVLSQMVQNPAVTRMMQNLLSNPQYMNQILSFNPQLRSLLDSNSQLRETMQNPEFLRQLTSPETLQQIMSFQQAFSSQLSGQQTNHGQGNGGGAGTPNNLNLDLLMNMFEGLGAGGLNVPNTSDVPPEQLYATQLSQLQEMGFFDTQENIRALSATHGNVSAAVERLLGNLG
ncbi:ubiquitin domain-containing protein DSK2b-like isoform X2 [Nymphaea colorata]|nr:ubiquitin domain-containing protein DSK2b-like isoform X2 [Nymphaea colorata]